MAKRVFLDTNPIIYLLNNINPFNHKVRDFIVSHKYDNFFTSTITDTEFLVLPYRENDTETIQSYYSFIKALHINKCFISDKIAEQAAIIRARYNGIKLGDALQLAASIECQCDIFLTNDSQLRQVKNANVVYLGDL